MRAAPISSPRAWPALAGCAILATLVFCARAWLVRAGGSSVPIWDQWDGEALNLYLPWLKGTLHWHDFFLAHNEHRIVLTRLADLALLGAFGSWNPWGQMLFNAALHAAAAASLAAIFWFPCPQRSRAGLLFGLAVFFTATSGWQNALWGFQSQVYFTNLLTIGAVAGLCLSPPLSRGWWFGLGAAGLDLFTTGDGLFAAAAALFVGLISLWHAPRSGKIWGSLALIAGVLGLGITLIVSVPGHASLHAHSLGQFLTVFMHCLAWPWVDQGAICLLMQLPLGWLVFNRWRQRQPLDAAERCALALGFFAALHAAAVAYSRGGGLLDARPLSRYQDPLLIGAAAQLFAALRLGANGSRTARIALLLWGGLALGGLISLTETNLTLHLPYKRAQDRSSLAVVRAYVATGDAIVFVRENNVFGRHPNPKVIQQVVDEPALRAILPADLHAAVDSPVGAPPWVVQHGPTLTAISITLFLALLGYLLLLEPVQPHPASAPLASKG